MQKPTPLSNLNPAVIEELYEQYQKQPESLDPSWKNFFMGFELAKDHSAQASGTPPIALDKEFRILNLIAAYRQRGHLFTRTNPVRERRTYTPTLDIENFELSKTDLDKVFEAGSEVGLGPSTLNQIAQHLKDTYCESVGVEYMYIRDPETVNWLKKRMESSRNRQTFSPNERKEIFSHLKQAVGFENFIHKKFVGQKRFSLEGSEALIPGLDAIIDKGTELGVEEFVIGMAHRGRLNVLVNTLKKPYELIFREFFGKEYEGEISLGDVKYHLGYDNEFTTESGKKAKLSLLPNPSHLETVGPIAVGLSRSRIDSFYDGDNSKIIPIVIHGDSAVAGQGVVYETVQMAQLKGYQAGGTLHIVINNQVGFTTNYLDARSSTYCTDVAKVTRCPVFHVNGDDVEALIYTVKLAVEYRQRYKTDVFIDILSYRKYGHNEGDEPRFTQPTLYKIINNHPNPRDIYAQKLIKLGIFTQEGIDKEIQDFDNLLDERLDLSKSTEILNIQHFLIEEYKAFKQPKGTDLFKKIDTAVPAEKLRSLALQLFDMPKDWKFFKKALKIVEDRVQMVNDNRLDWAVCELLAYGSLVLDGYPVRLSGQDSQRGTFAHRHAVFVEEETGRKYYPLNDLNPNQPHFHVFNSPLSEYGVLGFEYGYSLATPNKLTIWEAQFGDFVNVAQVIIDQYICSASEKWGLKNGLVLYLPHGYEGQGPEHSSARIERFIAQATNNNIQLMNLTSPANLFHALRRQLLWPYRLPMIIFTPKSLLRHPEVISTFEDLSEGHFMEVIDDVNVQPEDIKTIVLTTGKIYFQINDERKKLNRNDVAIIRIEQLYPFPIDQVKALYSKYKHATRFVWAQDEPVNMGAWPYVSRNYHELNLEPATRPESASPAGGLMAQHNKRLQRILAEIFK
jgi:2-oxoglutarate dehydrogenase E1 component